MARVVSIFLDFTRRMGHPHRHLQAAVANYAWLRQTMGRSDPEIRQQLDDLGVDGEMS